MDTSSKKQRSFETVYDRTEKSKLALGHPQYKGRADRLDLITHRMLGIKTSINGKNFTVCDISETGFSYAQKVPVKKNLSFKQVKLKVNQIASANYGKTLKYVCFFEGEPMRGGVEANGTIKNHLLFLILSADEIKQTVTSYLQSKAIRRSHDPQGYFEKLDLLLAKSRSMQEKGYNGTALAVVMNTTFQNLILEIGAPAEIFDKLYEGYINKPVFVKYGVSVDDPKEALSLIKFATVKNADRLKLEEKQKSAGNTVKKRLIDNVNQKYSFKDFTFVLWKGCLRYFGLDLNLDLPKIDKEKLALALKEEMDRYDGKIEKFADPELKEGDCKALESYLCNGLYWHLIEIDKKFFDREVIKKDIRKVISLTYQECLKNEKNWS